MVLISRLLNLQQEELWRIIFFFYQSNLSKQQKNKEKGKAFSFQKAHPPRTVLCFSGTAQICLKLEMLYLRLTF